MSRHSTDVAIISPVLNDSHSKFFDVKLSVSIKGHVIFSVACTMSAVRVCVNKRPEFVADDEEIFSHSNELNCPDLAETADVFIVPSLLIHLVVRVFDLRSSVVIHLEVKSPVTFPVTSQIRFPVTFPIRFPVISPTAVIFVVQTFVVDMFVVDRF